MGFSYPAWADAFYPRGTKPGDYLAYYSRCYDAVELDTTFYAAPDAGRVRRWAGQVPDDFRFSLKTPRDITHADDVGAAEVAMLAFIEPLYEFGPKLFDGGVVLLQFPPSFTAARWRELDRLARAIPSDVPLAAEFRHSSWWRSPGSMRLLEDFQIAWVSTDYVAAPRELRITANRAYVRLIGEHDRYPAMNREERDPSDDLAWWHRQLTDAAPGRAGVLFNNDYAGFSPATADRFKRLLDLDPARPPAVGPTLFG